MAKVECMYPAICLHKDELDTKDACKNCTFNKFSEEPTDDMSSDNKIRGHGY